MTNNFDEIETIIAKHLTQSLSPEEKEWLEAWRKASPDNEALLQAWENREDLAGDIQAFREITEATKARKYQIEEYISRKPVQNPVSLLRRLRPAMAVAALLLTLVVIGFLVSHQSNQKQNKDKQLFVVEPGLKNDIAPGQSRATLTLGDGSTVALDSAQRGAIASQGAVQVVKLDDGQLAYRTTGIAGSKVLYNTVSTPLGGTFKIMLPDGSLVWLNAGSSLHYPTSFSDTVRVVELTGEAYFEVAKNKQAPFRVRTREATEVKVFGTHFNVMAYEDEPQLKTTLLEGSVQVLAGGKSAMLSPGQQARSAAGQITVRQANTQRETAWKDGSFDFEDENLPAMMRQIGRWYNVDVAYAGQVDDRINLQISRMVPLSRLLSYLELTGRLQFKLEGRKLTVMPVKQ